MDELGLFPLDIVLLPRERIPLHIFEERYKELIGECLRESRTFGLVYAPGADMREIGTVTRVVDVLARFPDGRLNVIVVGEGRFRVVRQTEGRSFPTAQVEPVVDEDDTDQPSPDEVAACLTAYRRVVEAAGASPPGLELGAGSIAYQIAGRVEFGPDVKQELLESRSERARMLRLAELLDAAVDTLKLQRLARERAANDGHIRPDEAG